jgi:hypothetical protein
MMGEYARIALIGQPVFIDALFAIEARLDAPFVMTSFGSVHGISPESNPTKPARGGLEVILCGIDLCLDFRSHHRAHAIAT